jgi:hypothetical protein
LEYSGAPRFLRLNGTLKKLKRDVVYSVPVTVVLKLKVVMPVVSEATARVRFAEID